MLLVRSASNRQTATDKQQPYFLFRFEENSLGNALGGNEIDTAGNEFTSSVNYLLTYLCPSLPVEHRPSTTPRHRTLFWAALVIPDQLVPCCFSSSSVSRLQLLRGRPLFLFRCGFQVRAWRVVLDAGFLRVCPIQPHFLRSICLATGSCPAHSHSSSFRIFSCHWIL